MTATRPTFLGLPEDSRRGARVIILPIPLEVTTSYGQGCAEGPQALVQATAQVELFDFEIDFEFSPDTGFRTSSPWQPDGDMSPEDAVESIRAYVRPSVRSDALCVALGGEHTITAALLAEYRDDVGPLTVVQIDAHADLRDTYEGSAYSHACVAKRALDMGHGLIQIGVRALSRDEWNLINSSDAITCFTGHQIRTDPSWLDDLDAALGAVEGPVYLTIDVDGLDPSVIPGTGTPAPGGITYQQTLDVIGLVMGRCDVVGMDLVELAPIPGQQVSEFTAACLLARAVGLWLGGKGIWDKG